MELNPRKYKQAAFIYFAGTILGYAAIIYDFRAHLSLYWNEIVWPMAGLILLFLFFCIMVYRGERTITLFLFWSVLLKSLGFFWKLPADSYVCFAAATAFPISYGLARAVWNLPPSERFATHSRKNNREL